MKRPAHCRSLDCFVLGLNIIAVPSFAKLIPYIAQNGFVNCFAVVICYIRAKGFLRV